MILRSPIFRKLLWSAFLLIAATMVALNFYLTPYTVRQQVEHVEQRLEAEARILYGELASVPVDQLQHWSEEAGSRAQARVTLLDPEGAVLADSQRDPESMENHANRPEIQEAIRAGVGASRRHSVANFLPSKFFERHTTDFAENQQEPNESDGCTFALQHLLHSVVVFQGGY
jgi:hypothetical protein